MSAGRGALPAIPLTTSTTTSTQHQQPRDGTFQTWSSTSFQDDGHYTDIHWNVDGGAAEIPTWRQSIADEPDHYNYLEFNSYEALDPAVLEAQRQAPTTSHYTGIRSEQVRQRIDVDGYLEPVEQLDNGHYRNLEQQQQQSPRPRDHNTLRSEVSDTNRQGYERLDRSAVEELLRSPGAHSYADIETSSATDRRELHSYLELLDDEDIDDVDDWRTTAQNCDGFDASQVQVSTHQRDDIAGLNNSSDNGQDEMTASGGHEGLDPVEVEEFRQRTRQPHEHSGLRDNVEDLYSRPTPRNNP